MSLRARLERLEVLAAQQNQGGGGTLVIHFGTDTPVILPGTSTQLSIAEARALGHHMVVIPFPTPEALAASRTRFVFGPGLEETEMYKRCQARGEYGTDSGYDETAGGKHEP
jgi:hypothetical protein